MGLSLNSNLYSKNNSNNAKNLESEAENATKHGKLDSDSAEDENSHLQNEIKYELKSCKSWIDNYV